MSNFRFEQICRDACVELGLHDTTALSQGRGVHHANVSFEARYREGRESFTLVAELGPVRDEHKQQVYESLFTMQMLTWPQAGMRFGFDRKRQAPVFCLEVVFGAPLATIMNSLAKQIAHWRETLLAGKTQANPFEGEDGNALADFLAQGA